MSSETKQQIIVPFDFSVAANNALLCARSLATLFSCEISILHFTGSKKNSTRNSNHDQAGLKRKLSQLASSVMAEQPTIVNVYLLEGKVAEMIRKTYEKLNAIAVVAGLNSQHDHSCYFTPGSLVTDYRDLRIPIIVVHDVLPRPGFFEHIIMPVDFKRESKEKAVWGGYISKLKQSSVTIVVRDYHDEYFSASLRNNMALIFKLYENLEVNYQLVREKNIRVAVDKYAIEYAWLNRGDLIVVMATPEVAVDDLLFGFPEKKIVNNKYKLPVMLINPREDLYIPCGC